LSRILAGAEPLAAEAAGGQRAGDDLDSWKLSGSSAHELRRTGDVPEPGPHALEDFKDEQLASGRLGTDPMYLTARNDGLNIILIPFV